MIRGDDKIWRKTSPLACAQKAINHAELDGWDLKTGGLEGDVSIYEDKSEGKDGKDSENIVFFRGIWEESVVTCLCDVVSKLRIFFGANQLGRWHRQFSDFPASYGN